jgi:choline dehydrogenase-like flavoprotein
MQDYDTFVHAMGGKVVNNNTGWQNHAHLMGTVMMGTDRANSVTNHEGRSWDHDNLFLATTGLPSSAVLNPTLAGIALGLRTADIIAREV